jgi:uncharacterized protein YqgV (UPF0045/DUF77 family)
MAKAKKFLESMGINLETTTVISLIDGKFRQPDLCHIMEEFHEYCHKQINDEIQQHFNEESDQQATEELH